MSHVLEFCTPHPISSEQIVAKLRKERGHLDKLKPEDLFRHEQDHYGGLCGR